MMNYNNNIYINTDQKLTTKIEVNYIIKKKSQYDYWDFLFISGALLNKTQNLSKEDLHKKAAELYNVRFSSRLEELNDNLLLRIEVEFLNIALENNLKDDLIKLLNEIFKELAVNKKDLEMIINNYRQYLLNLKDSPSSYAKIRWDDFLYKDDKMRMTLKEGQQYLEKVNIEELEEKIKLVGDNSQFLLYETNSEYKNEIEEVINNFIKKDEVKIIEKTPTTFNEEMIIDNTDENSQQAIIQVLCKIKDISKSDRIALLVLNEIFGGGADARLFKRIREVDQLSYTVYSQNIKNIGIKMYMETDNKNKDFALGRLQEEFNNLNEISSEELSLAQKNLISNYLTNQNNYILKRRFIVDQLIDKNNLANAEEVIEKIKEVTLEDLQKQFKNLAIELTYIES